MNLIDVVVPLKTSNTYLFPSISDPDGDLTVITVKDSLTGSQPSFINLITTPKSLTIYPTVMTEVKAYTIIVVLSDPKDSTQY
jgi:hypothetical protein